MVDDHQPLLSDAERDAYRRAMAAYPVCSCGQSLWAPVSIERGFCERCRLRGRTNTPGAATELVRAPARYLQRRPLEDRTSEERKYKHAYQTPDGRWHIERAYGACGGGWYIIDTTGEHTGCTCCAISSDEHLATVPTLKAAKAFITEWSV